MGQMIDALFSKKSAVRHLIQLGITALLLVWAYVVMALLTGNWQLFSPEENAAAEAQSVIDASGILFMLFFGGAFGIATYWNAKKWMLPCLKKSGLLFVGTIPLVNKWVPEKMRHSWWDEIEYLRIPTTKTTYSDGLGEKFSTDNAMPLILAIPLGILRALVKGLGGSLLFLIAAIGIPLLASMSLAFGALVTQLLVNVNPETALTVAIVSTAMMAFVLIIQPVIVLIKGEK